MVLLGDFNARVQTWSCGKLSGQAGKNVFVMLMEACQLGGSGGVPPEFLFYFWCSEIDSGAI